MPHLQPPRFPYYNDTHSVTTDINERDSEFAELSHKRLELNSARANVTREIPNKREDI